VTPCCLV